MTNVLFRPNQVTPSFSSVYLTQNQAIGAGVWEAILFDIVETDGTDPVIYSRTTGEFTAPESAWYDVTSYLQSSVTLAGIRIVKNGDVNFPIIGRVPSSSNVEVYVRVQLGIGETVRVEAIGVANVLATSGLTPNTRASNAVFTMVKRFQDSRVF